MNPIVGVPAATALPELRAALDRVCDSLNIDWSLTPLLEDDRPVPGPEHPVVQVPAHRSGEHDTLDIASDQR
jgi:hypothetical protein